jgi:tRNA(fMet)-specific endonuclease VapC
VLVLDTDHLSELEVQSAAGRRLLTRLADSRQDAVITAISVEEQLRGWLAEIRSRNKPVEQIQAYARLVRTVESHARWIILPWDAEAVDRYEDLIAMRLRIGTQDIKIASITLAHDATLLTRNTSDFSRVPALKFENWLD